MKQNKFKTKSSMICDSVRADIINEVLLPGTRLVVSEVAKHYKVSEIPVREAFQVLVQTGFITAEPNSSFTVSLLSKKDIREIFSDTAEFGEYVSGPRVLPHEETKARMRAVLADIQDGTFAGRWIAENKSRGRTFFNSKRDQLAKHPMEQVGEELRRNMIWGGDKDLDTASN